MDGGFMQAVARPDENRVSSDDHVNAWCLADFYGDGCLAYAWVSTHCREVLVKVVVTN